MKNIILSLILFYSINLYSQNQIDREICIPDTKTYALNKVCVFSNSLVARVSDTFSIDSIIFYKVYLNNLYSDFSFSNDNQGIIYFINESGKRDTLIPDKEIPNF